MNSKIKNIYFEVPYLSIKYDNYFKVYEDLLKIYVGNQITIIEVGIFNGGSLFMWRQFFGPQARIIGVDLNPGAKKWEEHGFEIYIGDQSNELFWKQLYSEIGKVDVLIDDGGHTNRQQIITVDCSIENIKDGGLIIVEDVHASYLREFGNPWSYSFIKFTAKIVDSINSRAPSIKIKGSRYANRIYRISYFESIVVLHINTYLCTKSIPTSNGGITQKASDFRYQGLIQSSLFSIKNNISNNQKLKNKVMLKIINRIIDILLSIISRIELMRYIKIWRRVIK